MRVLHVIDAGRPQIRDLARPRLDEGFDDRVLSCQAVIRHSPGVHEHRTCILGPAVAARRAARLGLAVGAVVSPLLNAPQTAAGPMGRLIKSVRPDLVHWWTAPWTGGCFGRPGRAFVLESILGSTPQKLPFWLSGGGAITCGPFERDAAERLGLACFNAEPPAFVPSSPRELPPPALGARLLLLGPGADARHFLFVCGLLVAVGERTVCVVQRSAHTLARARRFQRVIQFQLDIIVSDAPRHELLPQCDLAVWMGHGTHTPSPAAIHSALAAGVPVVVPPSAAWLVPESLRPSMVALNATPGELARKISKLIHEGPTDDRVGCTSTPAELNRAFAGSVLAAYEGSSSAAPSHRPVALAQVTTSAA